MRTVFGAELSLGNKARTEASNPDGPDARLVLEDGTAEYSD